MNRIKIEMNLNRKSNFYSQNINLRHFRLSTAMFNFSCNILSTSSIFWIIWTICRCLKIDAMIRKQNAYSPQYWLYVSINWRTIFFVFWLILCRDDHKWNVQYPIAWHIVIIVPNFDGCNFSRENDPTQCIFRTTYRGNMAFRSANILSFVDVSDTLSFKYWLKCMHSDIKFDTYQISIFFFCSQWRIECIKYFWLG